MEDYLPILLLALQMYTSIQKRRYTALRDGHLQRLRSQRKGSTLSSKYKLYYFIQIKELKVSQIRESSLQEHGNSVMKSLMEEEERYVKAFQLYLERSSQQQNMQKFIHGPLRELLQSVGDGKARVRVIGVGSGAGALDLEMISQIRRTQPRVVVENHVIEPSTWQMDHYKVLVSETPDLDFIEFNWHNQTALEFEQCWKVGKMNKRADFIHLLQVLYHVEDADATVSFYQSLLSESGTLLITLASGTSGREKLWRTYWGRLRSSDAGPYITADDVKRTLDSRKVGYRGYHLPVHMDISACFAEGSEEGEVLLDWLTQVVDFSRAAPAELRAAVLETLRHPDCSVETQGKVLFNNSMEALVLGPLP